MLLGIAKHATANLLGSAIPVLVALLTIPAYLSLIGVERYGVLATLWALLAYFAFVDFGFGRAVSQRIARLSDAPAQERSDLLWMALTCVGGVGLLAGLALWQCAGYVLATRVEIAQLPIGEIRRSLGWLALFLPVALLSSVLRGALNSRFRFKQLTLADLASSILGYLVPLLVAAAGYAQLPYLLPATLLPRVLGLLLMAAASRRHVPLLRPRLVRTQLAALLPYGGWIWLVSLQSFILDNVARLAVAILISASATTYFSVPYDLAARLFIIPIALGAAVFPRVVASGVEASMAAVRRAAAALSLVMTPVVIIGVVLVKYFMAWWLGAEFADAARRVAELLLLGVWINALLTPYHACLLSPDRPTLLVRIYALEIPLYLLALWGGLRWGGIQAGALIWSLRLLVDAAVQLWAMSELRTALRQHGASFLLVAATVLLATAVAWSPPMQLLLGATALALFVLLQRTALLEAARTVYRLVSGGRAA